MRTKCETNNNDCLAPHEAWLACLVNAGFADSPTCAPVPGCTDALESYVSCIGKCGSESCSGASDGSCGCITGCGKKEYATNCQPAGDGKIVCTCSVNGDFRGKCLGPDNGVDSCGVLGSCCAPLFFVDG